MFTKKFLSILGAVLAVISLLGGLWAFEEHYATNKKVDGEIERVEVQVANAIQNTMIKNDYKFYMFMYDKLTNDLTRIRRQLRKDPNNRYLKDDYNEVVKERKEVKRKMDELLRKLN